MQQFAMQVLLFSVRKFTSIFEILQGKMSSNAILLCGTKKMRKTVYLLISESRQTAQFCTAPEQMKTRHFHPVKNTSIKNTKFEISFHINHVTFSTLISAMSANFNPSASCGFPFACSP